MDAMEKENLKFTAVLISHALIANPKLTNNLPENSPEIIAKQSFDIAEELLRELNKRAEKGAK
jgi:hypothetical protein